jgi:predicted DNA-binding transcriptional regulator AlpA
MEKPKGLGEPSKDPAVVFSVHELAHHLFNPTTLEESDAIVSKEEAMPTSQSKNSGVMLKIAGVQELVPYHRNSIYRWEKDGTFPKALRPHGPGGVRLWRKTEVMAWLDGNPNPPPGPRQRPRNRRQS